MYAYRRRDHGVNRFLPSTRKSFGREGNLKRRAHGASRYWLMRRTPTTLSYSNDGSTATPWSQPATICIEKLIDNSRTTLVQPCFPIARVKSTSFQTACVVLSTPSSCWNSPGDSGQRCYVPDRDADAILSPHTVGSSIAKSAVSSWPTTTERRRRGRRTNTAI